MNSDYSTYKLVGITNPKNGRKCSKTCNLSPPSVVFQKIKWKTKQRETSRSVLKMNK